MRITFDNYDRLEKLSKLKKSRFQRNKHPKEQIERLALIMREHGVRHPIHIARVQGEDLGEIAFGHGRKEAAKHNGWTEYPVIYQDFDTMDEYYACVQSDNAIAHWAELDLSSINIDIEELGLGPDFNIDLLGIKDFEIEPAEKYEAQAPEDDVPTDVETRCKPGDLWILGDHRLLCGDSTNIQHVERLMGGEKADMVFTDPPYGVNAVGGSKAFGTVGGPENHKNKIIKANVYKKIIGDDSTDTAKDSFALSKQFSKDQIFWGSQCYAESLPPSQGWIVWDKDTTGNLGDAELAWTNQDRAIRIFKHTWNGLIKQSERNERRVHPTQKPIALAEWCFENYGKPKSVLDLFGGSGSTLIACEKTNRKCYMMELDPHYCDVIIKRWENYSGKEAQLTGPAD